MMVWKSGEWSYKKWGENGVAANCKMAYNGKCNISITLKFKTEII